MVHSTRLLTQLSQELKSQALAIAPTRENHHKLAGEVRAFQEVEVFPSSGHAGKQDSFRIGAWNLERCKYPVQSADLLRQAGVDFALLSEMDYGMARSGNINTARQVAELLGHGYAFAVEFVELGQGNMQETILFQNKINQESFHGNAVTSKIQFSDPQVVHLGEPGLWFSLDWHHRRLGGRMAVGVSVELEGQLVQLVSAHLENLSTPQERRDQIDQILLYLGNSTAPAVLAGDLNTAALPDPEQGTMWFDHPEQFEPLFAAMSEAGFTWISANTPDPTRRIIDDGRPKPLRRRIDWMFVRGLEAGNPRTWAAVSPCGTVLSDHELITVDVRLA